ncbi:MAG: hypothetical protein Q8S31_08765, partial [Alphaproteobacteria bacterium]|nr:hypothetical protein [Alphaproteobacteria bacterium]
ITPTIHAGRRVDIDITQKVTDAVKTTVSGIDSPTINKTEVTTKLSLSDGESILMAGFIRNKKTLSKSGIPFLMDLPAIGKLFRSDEDQDIKQEIILMITPYIVDSSQEASDVTNAFKSRLDWLDSDVPAEPIVRRQRHNSIFSDEQPLVTPPGSVLSFPVTIPAEPL